VLTSAGNQLWAQDSPGILDVAEEFDHFGFMLLARRQQGERGTAA
jgi:hypothetical protein